MTIFRKLVICMLLNGKSILTAQVQKLRLKVDYALQKT